MTQPNPDEEAAKKAAAEEAAKKAAAEEAAKKAAAEEAAKKAAAAWGEAVDVLDVVVYVHRDPVLGGEVRQLGVVVGSDDQGLDVVPLEHYRVRVGLEEVTRLTVDDV